VGQHARHPSNQVPDLDPIRSHESRLNVGVARRERLDVIAIDIHEHERSTRRSLTERSRHDQMPGFELGPDPRQMLLSIWPAPLGHVRNVLIEQQVVHDRKTTPAAPSMRTDYACFMADLQKRGGYTPRRTREQRAYRLIVTGGVAGTVGVVGVVLAVAGVIGATIPVIALILAVICVFMFRSTVSRH